MYFKPPGAVFDCNIYVQMVLNPRGTAFHCFDLVVKNEVELFVSPAVLAEVAEVLARPRFKELVPDLTPEKVETFLEEIVARAIVITNVPNEFEYSRDPEDEPYINLAITAPATYLVSLDKDLLDLMKDSIVESRDFQHRYPMIKVVTPSELLRILIV